MLIFTPFATMAPPRWQKAEHKNERTRLRSMKRRSQLNVCDRNCDVSGFNACRFGHICFPGVNRLCQKDPFSAIDTLWVLKSRRSFWSRTKSCLMMLCFCKSHLDQVKVLRSTFITEGASNTVTDCYPWLPAFTAVWDMFYVFLSSSSWKQVF